MLIAERSDEWRYIRGGYATACLGHLIGVGNPGIPGCLFRKSFPIGLNHLRETILQ